MKQNEKNIQKDQELTKEELEQVNGGILPHDEIEAFPTSLGRQDPPIRS